MILDSESTCSNEFRTQEFSSVADRKLIFVVQCIIDESGSYGELRCQLNI